MFAKSVIALAAVASFAVAAPVDPRGAPAGWAYGYLEDYDTYHVRYLALKCQNQHNTQFFQDCCRPMLATENLTDNRKPECRPSQEATDAVVASLAAKNDGASATPASSASAASESEYCDPEDDSSSAAATTSSAAAATTTAAPQVQAAPAPSASTTTTSKAAEYIAPAPSSTTTTKAYTPPATTQAPAPTTQAPAPATNNNNNSQFTGGYATYFYQGGNAGACGTVHGDYDMIAAIDQDQWGSQGFGSGSNTCGRWLTVCNTNNNKCASVMIADVCPTCANGNSLDLSVGAFNAIANPSDGMVPIRWSWN